jgi:membrane protein YqaA with SNARE-associated domain
VTGEPARPLDEPIGPLIARAAVGMVVGIGALLAIAWVVRDPLTRFAVLVVERLGLVGIFAEVVLLDPVPGIGFQPTLLLGCAAGVPFLPLFAVTSAASLVSSTLCWAIGRRLREWERLRALLDRTRITHHLARHGALAVALASVTPFPHALATIGAGATGVPFGTLLRGALFRPFKILFYLTLFALGWAAAIE